MANGLRSLTLTVETNDEFGDVQSSTEQYVLLATPKDMRAVRVDGGASQVLALMP